MRCGAADAAGASVTARKALGFAELLERRRRGDEAAHAPVRQAPADLDAQAGRGRSWWTSPARSADEVAAALDMIGPLASRAPGSGLGGRRRTAKPPARPRGKSRSRRRVKFEKWQALGNDYLIVEARELPWELSAARVRHAVRGAHRRRRRRRAAARPRPRTRASSPTCASSIPTGQRPSCRATACARRSCTCAARGWTERRRVRVHTVAGPIRPTITGPHTCRVDMGTRFAELARFSLRGLRMGAARCEAGGRTWAFQHVSIGNPQCAIAVEDAASSSALDLARSARRSSTSRCSRSAPTCRGSTPLERRRRSARGSSSAGWGRPCPRAPAPPAQRSPTCCRGGRVAGDACSSTAASSKSRSAPTWTSP